MKAGRRLLVAVILSLTGVLQLGGCGCLIVGREAVIDENFAEEQAARINPGMTTRKDILEWFGPPSGVGRPGIVMKELRWSKSSAAVSDVRTEEEAGRFAGAWERTQMPLLYYYESAKLNWTEFGIVNQYGGVPLSVPTDKDKKLTVKRLWVLIDESSGKVVTHRLEIIIEGKVQPGAAKKQPGSETGSPVPWIQ